MPKLKEFYENNPELRDKFEIVAIHETRQIKTLAEMDEKIADLERDVWKGKLPFPILMDTAEGASLKAYGIFYFPTIILVDPDGNIVKGGSLELLKEKLGVK